VYAEAPDEAAVNEILAIGEQMSGEKK
jgi:hypothetical protein